MGLQFAVSMGGTPGRCENYLGYNFRNHFFIMVEDSIFALLTSKINTMEFNDSSYAKVPQQREQYNKLGYSSYNSMIRLLFGGSLEKGDIIQSIYDPLDVILIDDPMCFTGFRYLSKSDKFSDKSQHFYGIVNYQRLKR